ncbi:MAG: AAA family ATPase, partial [Euryarchaeota archaeon]|nr:AAA family ATPase [Euryarchaeota archaeon]
MIEELTAEQVRRKCSEFAFDCETTADLTPLEQIIGQDRAVRALQFGLNIERKGFNVFISGLPGTGRKTAILDFVRELAARRPTPPDWCYVNNFKDSSRPNAIALPPGKGSELKKAMEGFVSKMRTALHEAFESEDYAKRRDAMLQRVNRERNEMVTSIGRMAKDAGFMIQQSPIGVTLVPLVEGKPLSDQEFIELPDVLQQQITNAREALQERIGEAFRPLRDVAKKADKEMLDMNKEVARFAISPYLDELREHFRDIGEVVDYLEAVENDILENLPLFLAPPKDIPIDPTRNYLVNLVVDNSAVKGAPAEIELNPTYTRLFGYSERESRMGALVTDYTMVRAGTAHRANGGFLVIPAEQMFRDPLVWDGLKQMISSERLEMEDPAARLGYMITKTLRPEPIPFDGKVIILGSPQVYEILFGMDPDFRELFKV